MGQTGAGRDLKRDRDVKGKASYVMPIDDKRLVGCGAYRSAVRSMDDLQRSGKA